MIYIGSTTIIYISFLNNTNNFSAYFLKMVNFYPLTHPILVKTKNQILFFFLANTCKQPEKNICKEVNLKKPPNILDF